MERRIHVAGHPRNCGYPLVRRVELSGTMWFSVTEIRAFVAEVNGTLPRVLSDVGFSYEFSDRPSL